MSELLPTFTAVLLLAACSHFVSKYDNNLFSYHKKERLFYFSLSLLLIFFAGLRTHFNDTQTYIHSYINTDPTTPLSAIDWKLGSNPGYNLLSIIFRRMNIAPQTYLMIYAFFTVGTCAWFIRKYTTNIWMSVFLYIVIGGYLSNLAAMKQCTAVAFCLLAVDQALQKKWILFTAFTLIGSLFHPYALLYFLVPVLQFRPWSLRTYGLISIALVAGLLLQPLMGTLIDITTMLGEEYNAEAFSGEGVNPFRLAVVLVPTLLSFVSRNRIKLENNRSHNVMMNLTMLNGLIMYIALFGTANYFARLANYFAIFQVITLPWLMTHYEFRSRRLLLCVSVAAYFLFFYYENGINQPFDYYYASVSFWDYIRSLL